MSQTHRISVSLPPEIKKEIETLKKEYYYLSYSEIYRRALAAGLKSLMESKKQGDSK